MIVVLDNIRSVHNVGSIFRTADAAGVAEIYLCGITPTPLNKIGKKRGDFIKVSLGAEDSMPWRKVENVAEAIKSLKDKGFHVFALEQVDGSLPYTNIGKDFDFQRSVLVLGNEVSGLNENILKLADNIIEIPMAGKKESLNVAVAFGVAIFEMRRRGRIDK